MENIKNNEEETEMNEDEYPCYKCGSTNIETGSEGLCIDCYFEEYYI